MRKILRHRHLTLRAKVSALTATVLASIMVVFGVFLYLGIGRVLIDNTAQGLRASAGGAINERLNGQRQPRPPRNDQFLPFPAPPPNTGAGAPPQDEMRALNDLAKLLTTRDTAALTTNPAGTAVGDGPVPSRRRHHTPSASSN
ncbi:MAG: hypothetical protein LC793_14360 [Thermomicrobia bacterium]|nr:hypothetical protein [Thermomicrobia bacterium]